MSLRNRRIALAAAAMSVVVIIMWARAGGESPPPLSDFAATVNLAPLSSVAVQLEGRLKSFDSFARTMMRYISGPRSIHGQSAAFSYLDLLLRNEDYHDANVIYVKREHVRQRIARALASDPQINRDRLAQFQKTGMISPLLLSTPEVQTLFDEMERDVVRTARSVEEIRTALTVFNPRTLSHVLRVIPPPGGDAKAAWLPGRDLWGVDARVPDDAVHAGMGGGGVPGVPAELATSIQRTWGDLTAAWQRQDAPAASTALAALAGQLRTIEPQLYPPVDKLNLESWYFRNKAMTWTWVVYLLAAVPMLMGVVYRWRPARVAGLAIFLVALGLHTASLGIRWHLSGRIPNSNMYEAITASTWLGGVGALLLETFLRRTPLQGLFSLAAAICAAAAMMCSHFLPVQLSSDISNIMPILHDVWLYIHTNVIIFSYCLVAMSAVTAILYLAYRFQGGLRDYAKAGGMGALILGGTSSGSFLRASRVSTGQVLDGATMVLMELAFVLLWAGIIMGAIWADHSWGRPWGWDPKEVFALNTFIVFLLLLHVRLKVRDKGLWTAILACSGCAVMLFNWIVVNFVITGLHSYA